MGNITVTNEKTLILLPTHGYQLNPDECPLLCALPVVLPL
jgi:hypothetical protein